jgi:2-keto-3-deoxy-L-rhamnonate aldolase RhmA
MATTLKQKMQKRKVTIGSWVTMRDPIVAEIMARAGYDWLTVDMEHSVISLQSAQDLIRCIAFHGVVPLVRVGHNDATIIKRVMDAGAHGVIVPMVNTREDAIRAVQAVKYPPYGCRGVGLARAQGYGFEFEVYKDWNQSESIVIVQIEHIKAVDHMEEIMKVNGVDGFIVGPYDLSGSLGVPGDFKHPKMTDALSRIAALSKQHDYLAGYHVIEPDPDALQEKINSGYRFLAYSLDTIYLGKSCRNAMDSAQKLGK